MGALCFHYIEQPFLAYRRRYTIAAAQHHMAAALPGTQVAPEHRTDAASRPESSDSCPHDESSGGLCAVL